MLAQELYRLYPARIDHLILADTYAGWKGSLPEEMVEKNFHPHGFRLMAKSLADTDTSCILSTIGVPTLLLWGEGDQRSPLGVAEQFRAAIPHSKLEIIAGAGHVSNMEKPEAFNARLRQFLSA